MNIPHDPTRDDDYLWDRSGSVDPQIARLECVLAPYALRAGRGVYTSASLSRAQVSHARHRSRWRAVLASAAVLAMFAVGIAGWYQHRLQWPAGQPWQLSALNGEARIDGRAAIGMKTLAPGSVLETGNGGSASMRAARIGQVALGENSRFSLIETRTGRHRLQLEYGSLWARVWAPPGALGVSMPTAEVWDLGCEFVLKTDAAGYGQLIVRSGWVQIDNGHWEILVPQNARVELRGKQMPGTPYDVGASAAFVAALRKIDAQGGSTAADGDAVRRLVAASRPQDAISLLLLLKRYPQLGDGPVFDRMVQLMPADATVTREALRARGTDALDPWWDSLPYPRMKRWWMQWPDAFGTQAKIEVLLNERR
jgi:hypothetical protein